MADAEGLEALNLGRLAERLGVSTPALYKHVDGLAGLRRELAVLGLREMTRCASRAAAGKAREAAVTAMANAYRDYGRAHPGVQAAARRAPAAGDEEWSRAGGELVDIVVAVLSGYGLAGDDALHAVRGFRSLLDGFVTLETGGAFALALDTDESFRRLIGVFTAGLESTVPRAKSTAGATPRRGR
jgi:AcrR family transcriptional regulator